MHIYIAAFPPTGFRLSGGLLTTASYIRIRQPQGNYDQGQRFDVDSRELQARRRRICGSLIKLDVPDNLSIQPMYSGSHNDLWRSWAVKFRSGLSFQWLWMLSNVDNHLEEHPHRVYVPVGSTK